MKRSKYKQQSKSSDSSLFFVLLAVPLASQSTGLCFPSQLSPVLDPEAIRPQAQRTTRGPRTLPACSSRRLFDCLRQIVLGRISPRHEFCHAEESSETSQEKADSSRRESLSRPTRLVVETPPRLEGRSLRLS